MMLGVSEAQTVILDQPLALLRTMDKRGRRSALRLFAA